MERRGDYGYDAPYALIAFAVLGVISAAAFVGLLSGGGHTAALMSFYAAFFLANAFSFFYTRYGKFQAGTTRHCRHSCHVALRRDPPSAWSRRVDPPQARMALLVRQSVRGHDPRYRIQSRA
jgi:hypothetical protein